MNMIIRNAHVIDCSHDFYGDIYIKDGVINNIGKNISIDDYEGIEVIDATGKIVMPSFIDTHTHFRDPGFTYKEDIITGSMAAAKGGFTVVNTMANTNPICSDRKTLNYINEKSKECGLIDVVQCVSITRNFDGSDISHLDEFEKDEIICISDDGKGVNDSKVMMDAMYKAKENGWVVLSHAESSEFTKTDMRLAENMMTLRDVTLAGVTGAHLHMAHVSTKEAMEYIIEGKNKGYNVTCEVTPHHIGLDSSISNYRVNPPIREKEDVDFLIKAIKDGYVDSIGTDHAPHTDEEKEKGAPGLIGLQTAFRICYTKLVKENNLSMQELSRVMSAKPAEILNLNKGRIEVEYDGDLVIVDTDVKRKVTKEEVVSKSTNMPFIGMEYYGEIVKTIRKGKVVYSI